MVFWLFEVEGFRHSEVAAILEIPEGTSKKWLFEAKQELKELLDGDAFMTFDCKDLERALAVPELLPDAREHAKVCDACRRELWLWGEMSAVAPGLREEWETPDLWPKIRESLAAQQKAAKPRELRLADLGGHRRCAGDRSFGFAGDANPPGARHRHAAG